MRSHGSATLADLVAEAGAGTELAAYLEDRGIKTPATLALLANDDAEFDSVVLQPLMSGWKTKAGGTITVPESEKPIAKAILKHHVELGSWRLQGSDGSPQPSFTTTAKDEKIPKTLPAGVWSAAIKRYESQQIGGSNRTFPTQELVGAEVVLARIHHELTISKLFTPVGLGEILQKRTFQASGEPNMLAKKESKPTTFTVSNDQLVATEEQQWQTPWAARHPRRTGQRQVGLRTTGDGT